MMSSLKSLLLLTALRRHPVRELSTCCACLARSRFNLTGNFKFALQQQENYFDENEDSTNLQKTSQHRKEKENRRPWRQQDRFNNQTQEGSLFSTSDQCEYPNRSHSEDKSNFAEDHFQRPFHNSQQSGSGKSLRPHQNLNTQQLRSENPLVPCQNSSIPQVEQSEIPVITQPVKISSPKLSNQSPARYNKKKRKFTIVGGDLSEDEKQAHMKQFPDKRKQLRVRDNLVEIDIAGEIVFGIYPVLLALKSKHRSFNKLFLKDEKPGSENVRLQEICDLASQANVPVDKVPGRILEQLSGNRPHQGVCLDASILKPEELKWSEEAERVLLKATNKRPEDVLWPKTRGKKVSLSHVHETPCLWLLLDKIVDPMNLGAILRSSYYFGVNRIVTTKNSCRLSPVVSKASSGALEVFPPYVVTEAEEFLIAQAARGWDVIGTCVEMNFQNSQMNVHSVLEYKLINPTVLIIGNEGHGLEPKLSKLCSSFLTIYPGQQHSEPIAALNVGVAAGVILHSLLGRTLQRSS